MNYLQYTFTKPQWSNEEAELLMALLSDEPFESFEITSTSLIAYIQEALEPGNWPAQLAEQFPEYTLERIWVEGQNWNAIWESQFEPVEVTKDVYIRALFHAPAPQYTHELIIQPKMSFGTGHHPTTFLMMQAMQAFDFKGKRVLDMGCGTGILGILAAKMGAAEVEGIDNDPQCVENALENVQLNQVVMPIYLWGYTPTAPYDAILANIQRNVLLEQMPWYAAHLKSGGRLWMSGIYTDAIPSILEKAQVCGFKFIQSAQKQEWAVVEVEKT